MSTSVILEGSIQSPESPEEVAWNGTWRFSKDKKGSLQFTYKKISKEIPRDLYEYVSFLDPASLHDSSLQAGSASKVKKRGRGRPRSNSYNLAHPDGLPPDAPTQDNGEASHTVSGDVKVEPNASENDLRTEDASVAPAEESMKMDEDTPMKAADEHNHADEEYEGDRTDVTQEEKKEPAGPVLILEDHPLMGVWEGSFKVKNAKGAEDTVPETLFFYSTLGTDASADFKDLPPEPSFPFCLMKGPQWSAFLTAQLAQKESQPQVANQSTSDAVSNSGNQEQPSHEIKTENGTETQNNNNKPTEDSKPEPPNVSGDSSVDGVKQEVTDADQKPSQNPMTADAFEEICKRVLIGFGRNAIGRFSVAAVYDEATREMRCEKKYMTVKHTVKRGRRSYAEYAMAYNNGLSVDSSSTMPPPAVGIKPQRRYSIDTTAVPTEGSATTELNTFQTRQRTKSTHYYPYDDDFSIDGTSYGPASKKKKMGEVGRPSQGTLPSSRGSQSRDKNRDSYPVVLTEENIHEMLKADKNLLIGPRNPDNDLLLAQTAGGMMSTKHSKSSSSSQTISSSSGLATSNLAGAVFDLSTGLLYREAFLDIDTGEIYEGEWYNGQRHGRGIVLYADGLMYEGMWYKGKEHGKGDLMLSDRTIVFTGDWYEGYFHGQGTYHFPNGDVYTGDWKEGIRHGRGEYVYKHLKVPKLSGLTSSSSSSSGSTSNATSSSSGDSVNTAETKYSGDWRDNRRHGKGRFTWADGSFYEGDWENDLRHGRGVLELSNGFKYEGAWFRNIMEGKGTCIFPSGQSYQGTFRGGLRDGRGSITFAEGAVYEGRFREDRFDGQGTLKINQVVPANDPDEVFIPVQLQSDLWRIHWKAGFGATHH